MRGVHLLVDLISVLVVSGAGSKLVAPAIQTGVLCTMDKSNACTTVTRMKDNKDRCSFVRLAGVGDPIEWFEGNDVER